MPANNPAHTNHTGSIERIGYMNDSDTLHVLDSIYAMALDESALSSGMRAVASYVGACSACLLTGDTASMSLTSAESVDLDPIVPKQYIEYYGARDVLVPPALAVPPGSLMTETSLVTSREFLSSEVYADVYGAYDVPHLLVVWAYKTSRELQGLSLQRSRRQGSFAREDEQRYAVILPHVMRALRIRRALHASRQRYAAYARAFDCLPFGAILLDTRGRIACMSSLAESLMQNQGAIYFRDGEVHAVHRDDDAHLQKAIRHVLAERPSSLPGETLTVRRRLPGLALTVFVLRAQPQDRADGRHCAMLLVLDPTVSGQPSWAAVQQSLGLTTAEARLACLLFKGVSIREAAEELRVSVNTCKTQLKSIYAKTGCRSQAELAKLILMTGAVDAS
jgi:DNA-binding CsgD family transcriptional regulator